MGAKDTSDAVDFGYLEGFAAGDRQVISEVLSMFREQAAVWARALDSVDPGWRDIVHTIKGSARGIGANALGDVCARVEAQSEAELAEVLAALSQAVADIEAYQARHGATGAT